MKSHDAPLAWLVALAVLTGVPPAAAASERPYVAVYKSGAGAYLAGIKVGRRFLGEEAVEQTATMQEVVPGLTAAGKTTTVYQFTAVEGQIVFYAALPPGMTAYRPQDAGNGGQAMAEGIANALTYFATMYSPVVRLQQGGQSVSLCDFMLGRAPDLAAELPECRAATNGCRDPVVPYQGVAIWASAQPPGTPKQVVGIPPARFDADGLLEEAWFAANRDRLRPVTVLNSACVPTLYHFEGAEANFQTSFSRYRFRGRGEVFAEYSPEDPTLAADVLVITGQSLTPSQQEYLARNPVGRWGVKAGETAGRIWGWGREKAGELLGQ